jgi:hypothetical protein
MPLLTEADHPRKRRLLVWALIPAVVVLALVGLFGWSCVQPVRFGQRRRWVAFGRTTYRLSNDWQSVPGDGWWFFKLPGGRRAGWYGVEWQWR